MTLYSFLIFLPGILSGGLILHWLWPERQFFALLLKASLGMGLGMGLSSILYFLSLMIAPGKVNIFGVTLALLIGAFYLVATIGMQLILPADQISSTTGLVDAEQPISAIRTMDDIVDAELENQPLADKWERIFKERGEVLKALEAARGAGIIGHSLDAEVVMFGAVGTKASPLGQLQAVAPKMAEDILIVSQLAAQNGEMPSYLWELEEARRAGKSGMSAQVHDNGREAWAYYSEPLDSVIAVFKARGDKCERCWKYDTAIGSDRDHPAVCPRCAAVLNSGVSV